MAIHDPIRQSKYLRQTLSQDKKPVGFFLAAGCPLAVAMGKDWPLIPDVANLTRLVSEMALKETEKEPGVTNSFSEKYQRLLDEMKKMEKQNGNIEDILSFVRGMKQICLGADQIRGFTETDLEKFEVFICKKIVERLRVPLPNTKTPYHNLARWIHNIERETAIEIFTTNYDLLLEEAFEQIGVPYFDGFVGSKQPFFDLRAVEDNKIPKHWSRIWKIHGSINWYQKKNKEVYRSTSLEESDAYIIYPSHLKYDQSRKMPYIALIDRLNSFLRQTSAVLIMSGYSFNDDHLNDTILNALKANPTAMVIGLLYGLLTVKKTEDLPDGAKKETIIIQYENALKLAETRSNLSIWCFDEGVIGGLRAKWYPIKKEHDEDENVANAVRVFEDDVLDPDGKATGVKTFRYEFHLGNFAILGDFLQELVGQDQFKIVEDGK